jgi:hypothetical protein
MKKLSKKARIVPTVAAVLVLIAILSCQQANATADITDDSAPQNVNSKKPFPCYGPCIISNVSSTQANIGESITVAGKICPPANNVTIRIAFTRPDYSWVDDYVIADNKTGEFNVTRTLDMAGFWNIFPIYGHISDRLYANVTDPKADPLAPTPTPKFTSTLKPSYTVLAVGISASGIAIIAATWGTRRKTRKISSFRLFVQIAFVFILFFGVFIDHQNLPWPAEQIAPHE